MKNLKTLLSILIILTSFVSQGQTVNYDWASNFNGLSIGEDLAIDAAGSSYSTGYFADTVDFDPSSSSVLLIANGIKEDAFLTKLDANGNLLWAHKFGGPGMDKATSVTIDATGNVYFSGFFDGLVDFDPSSGVSNLNSVNGDIFICKFTANGTLIWAKQIDGFSYNNYLSLEIDNLNNIILSGKFEGTCDFNPSSGTYNLTSNGMEDVFVLKLNSNGNFIWAKAFGGIRHDSPTAISIDGGGNVYILGGFEMTVDFDPGSGVYNLASTYNDRVVFITKLSSIGNFVWAKHFEYRGGNVIYENDIITDNSGGVTIVGITDSAICLNPGICSSTLTKSSLGGRVNSFVIKLNSNGTLNWGKMFENVNSIKSVNVDAINNIYLTGYFGEGIVDFDPGTGIYNLNGQKYVDMFIQKLNPLGDFIWVKHLPGNHEESGKKIEINTNGDVYTIGVFYDSIDCDPGSGTDYLVDSNWYPNSFVHKMSQSGLSSINEEIDISNTIKVFPNPTNGEVYISLENSVDELNIEVFTIKGELVLQESYFNTDRIKLNLDNKPGIYLVRLTGSEINKMIRIIKN